MISPLSPALSPAGSGGAFSSSLCSDCPPQGYPTDQTRCAPCPRRVPSCLGRTRYETKAEASAAGLRGKLVYVRRHCRRCGGWHLILGGPTR